MGRTSKAAQRIATVNRSRKGDLLLPNPAALQLLTSAGERYVRIVMADDGVLRLYPIEPMEGELAISRILVPTPGCGNPRIHILRSLSGQVCLGPYLETRWNEQFGCLEITSHNRKPEAQEAA